MKSWVWEVSPGAIWGFNDGPAYVITRAGQSRAEQTDPHRVWMARSEEKVPLAMVWSLLSYRERRLRLWRSWKASTRRQLILLAFRSLWDPKRINTLRRKRMGDL